MVLAWIGITSAFLSFLTWLANRLNDNSNCVWLAECLTRSGEDLYSSRIDYVLNKVNQWLSPNAKDKAVAAKPWGWPLFDLTMRLSIFYPITIIVVLWIICGKVYAGDLVFLNGALEPSYRIFSFIILASLLLYSIIGIYPTGTLGVKILRIMVLVVGLVVAIGTVLLSVNDSDVRSMAVTNNPNLMKIAIVWCQIALLGIYSFLQLFWRKHLFGIVSSVFVITLSITLSAVFPYAMEDRNTALLFIPLVTSALAAYSLNYLAKYNYGLSIYGFVIFLILLIGLVAFLDLKPTEYASMMVLVCFGILPILNGVFDYLSIGLTRCLVRMGAKSPQQAFLFGFIDLFFACIAFVALIFSMMLTVALIERWIDSTELLDLGLLIAELGDDDLKGDYWWLYLTVFSTLAPTVLHWIVSFWSLPGMVLRPWRTRLAGFLRQRGLILPHRWLLAGELVALSMCWLFIVSLPGTILIWLTPKAVNKMGEFYLFLANKTSSIL